MVSNLNDDNTKMEEIQGRRERRRGSGWVGGCNEEEGGERDF